MVHDANCTPTTAPIEGSSARAVFLAWERLRLVYNAVLILEVLLLSSRELSDQDFRSFLVRGAIGANLCF